MKRKEFNQDNSSVQPGSRVMILGGEAKIRGCLAIAEAQRTDGRWIVEVDDMGHWDVHPSSLFLQNEKV